MSIRTALSSLPTWPALVIAPVLILIVAAVKYVPAYQECTRLAQARTAFTSAVEAAARQDGGELRLDRAAAMPGWDQVRILQAVKADGPLLDCPFGWDLTQDERRELIAEGRFGILVFAKDGQVVGTIEYRSDLIRFELFLPRLFHVVFSAPAFSVSLRG